jgi:hypothetical protein
MKVSPVATELFGSNPKVFYIIGGTLNALNDDRQEVLTGLPRAALINLMANHKMDWAMTRLVKCCPGPKKKYSLANISECVNWIGKEHKIGSGLTIISMGKDAGHSYFYDFEFEHPTKLFQSKSKIDELSKILSSLI